MSDSAKTRALARGAEDALNRAGELLAAIEEDRPGTVLLEKARVLVPVIRDAITRCRAMPAGKPPEAREVKYVALHIEKAAQRAHAAARSYPMEGFIWDAACYLYGASLSSDGAADRAAERAKNGHREEPEPGSMKAERDRLIDEYLSRPPGRLTAEDAGKRIAAKLAERWPGARGAQAETIAKLIRKEKKSRKK